MRVLVLDHYYEAFLRSHYLGRPQLANAPYEDQKQALMAECFGTSDFYSTNLRACGHEAEDVVVNCKPLQQAWAREFGDKRRHRITAGKQWEMQIVLEQVRSLKPDVLYIQNVTYFDSDFVSHLKTLVGLVAGQCAYPVDWSYDFSGYDSIVSSFPHYVERFQRMGMGAYYLPLAFEPRVLELLTDQRNGLGFVFVGGLSTSHERGYMDLEEIVQHVPIDIWGYGVDQLPETSKIRSRHQGEAWGLGMYRILNASTVCLNRHGEVAERFANNMRLYEATGVGTCLITDMKSNLSDFFEIDSEVVTYLSAAECIEKVRYLLDHSKQRKAIAAAGQQRTLRDHTYLQRMEELGAVLDRKCREVASVRAEHRRKAIEWRPAKPPLIETVRELVIRSPIAPLARWGYRRLHSNGGMPISTGHRIIDKAEAADKGLSTGWKSPRIAVEQRNLVNEELKNMYQGRVIPVFDIAAQALRATGLIEPTVLEVGCASGYYSEVLGHLLGSPVKYCGVDFSEALVRSGSERYPDLPLVIGEATALPFSDSSLDVILSAGAIMHIPEYREAVKEAFRVSASWCIFHRTPVTETANTTLMEKQAYGVPVVELYFNEKELLALFEEYGGKVVETYDLGPYPMPDIQDAVEVRTYLCHKV